MAHEIKNPLTPIQLSAERLRHKYLKSLPKEDALLATQNILLAAEALGLGTCLIGFAVAAMRKDPGIKRVLGIPDDETVHAVIAIGHPNVEYARPAGRKPPVIRYFAAGETRA